uniref:Myosin heavy chain-related n=1 Tax=Zea mays TaxID=4577 RepID=A0A804QYQ5_MAIZE
MGVALMSTAGFMRYDWSSSKRPHTPDHCQHYKALVQGRTGNKTVNNVPHEMEAHSAVRQIETEMATKWNHQFMKASLSADYDYIERKQRDAGREIYTLREELVVAQDRIHELEAECRSTKKQLDHLAKNISEEKASLKSREHDKFHHILDAVKEELNRERKQRHRAEMMNSKLLNDLSEMELAAKRYSRDYEKERKARVLMEEVCDELAKEITEDRAEVEAMRSESMKIRDELEEEKKMLQMAEVWREERVHMKLVDAKLTLENKYSQLSMLQNELEDFLRFHPGCNMEKGTVREAERLKEAICSSKINGIKEFSYKLPPPSEDIYAVFEELKQREDTAEKVIVQCNGNRPKGRASRAQTASPETDMFLENQPSRYCNQPRTRNEAAEDDSEWEAVSQVEENGSSNSPGGSEPSVNGFCGENDASVSGTDRDENCDNDQARSEISEVCSIAAGWSHNKRPFVGLWRSSSTAHRKSMGSSTLNGRSSNARMSNLTESPDLKSSEVCGSPRVTGQWRPDLLNPDIVRAIKGCIDWSHGAQKHGLKSEILEARIDGSKVQLRQALKQKI